MVYRFDIVWYLCDDPDPDGKPLVELNERECPTGHYVRYVDYGYLERQNIELTEQLKADRKGFVEYLTREGLI